MDDVLRGAPAEDVDQLLVDVLRGVQRAVRAADDREAGGLPARVDRGVEGLVDRRAQLGAQHVPGLVVGDGLALARGQHRRRLARARDDAQEAFEEVVVGDPRTLVAGGHDRALVEHLGELGATGAGGHLGEVRQVDILGQRLALRVHVEDRQAACLRRRAHVDVAREAAGAQQRRVERVEPVGGGDDEQLLVAGEAVHLDEQLVQRLVGLAVAGAGRAATARGADRVDLVDEDDRRRAGTGLGEQVAHAAGAHADVHLDEVGAAQPRRSRRRRRSARSASRSRCPRARAAAQRRSTGSRRACRRRAARPHPRGARRASGRLVRSPPRAPSRP